MGKIAHSAFIDLENALGQRVGNGWKRIFRPIQQELHAAIRAKDWAKANKVVDQVNTDDLVAINFNFAKTIAVSSLLLGASRLVSPADSHVAANPPDHQIGNALTQWGFVVARNAAQNVRLSLHLMLARLEHEAEQARHTITKDESDDPEQFADDPKVLELIDSIRVDGANFMSLAANLMVSRLSSFGFLLEAQQQGIEKYEISAILDDRTCPVCEALDGQVFSIQDGIAQAASIMEADDADSLKSVAPWPSQSKSSVESLQNSDAQDLVDSGLALPPYHAGCRCITVDSSDDQSSSTAPTVEDAATAIADGLPSVSQDEISAILGLVLVPDELQDEFAGESDEEDTTDTLDENPDDVDEEVDEADDPEESDTEEDPPKKRKRPVAKFDPWHDEKGKFTSGPGGDSNSNAVSAYQAAVGARQDFADSITDHYHLTDDEDRALRSYTTSDYVSVNGLLRGNFKASHHRDPIISGLDSIISKGTLPRDIELYRGIFNAETALGSAIDDSLVGKTFTDKGFVSTSLSRDSALSMTMTTEYQPNRVLVEIEAPKGMHAGANSINFEFEKEVILPRGTTFRVKSVSTEDMESTVGTKYAKVRKIVVEPVDIAKSSPLKLVGAGKFIWEAGDIEI